MIRFLRKSGLVLAAVALVAARLFASDYPFQGLSDIAGQAEEIAKQCEENPTSATLTTAGWISHIYRNDHGKARELFEKALEGDPRNPWARYGLCVLDEMRGDFDSVLLRSLALCQDSPAHPVALLSLLSVRDLFGQIGHYNSRVEPVLKNLLAENHSQSVQFDEICREILAAIRCSQGDAGGLERLVEENGFIAEWKVVGPFGEYPNLAFLSTWQPETDRVLKSRYKVGHRVLKPRAYSSEYGTFRPHAVSPGVTYAETFLHSAVPEEVVLRISSPFPIELSLGGHSIYAKDLIRNDRPLIEYVKVRLSPGYNRLLMKCLLGNSDRSPLFSYKKLRLTCNEFKPLQGVAVQVFRYPYGNSAVTVSASRHRAARGESIPHMAYDPPALKYFADRFEENGKDPLALGLAGILRGVQGDVQKARSLLSSAVGEAPSYSYFNYVLGVITLQDLSLPTQVRQSAAQARFRSALAGQETFPLAQFETALLEIREEKKLEAIARLNECVSQSPGFFPLHETLYTLYRENEWRNEQLQQLERMLSLDIESCQPYHIARDYYSRNQHAKLAEVIEKLQSTHIHALFLAQRYSDSGEDAKALREYRRLKEAQPFRRDVRRQLIRLYQRNQRWAEAQREAKEVLKVYPKDISLWRKLAELYACEGRGWTERQTWNRVLRLRPADRDARKAARILGRKDILDDYDIPSLPYVSDPSIREKYAGVSSAVIIDQAVDEIYSDGSSRQKTHQLILLNDKKAIDQWGELSLGEDELLELRTIKKDGSVVEPEPPEEGKGSFSMGGLQEGDFIEFKYITSNSVAPSRSPHHLGDRFFFQVGEQPMEISQYIVIVPEDMKLTYEQVNVPRGPSVIRRDGKKVYKWEMKDVPTLPSEPLAAPGPEYLPFVRVGLNYDEDEEFIAYENHNVALIKPSREIREATAGVLGDCSDDVESRARAIYSFVNKEVRGGGGSPYFSKPAAETLADKSGDRSCLAKAMLDAAGVESRVLAARGELATTSEVFPGGFDAGLLAIQDDEGRRLRILDFGNRHFPYGYVRSALQGGTAIPLRDLALSDFGLSREGPMFLTQSLAIPRVPAAENSERKTLEASVADDGSIEGTQIHMLTGDRAASLRESILGAESYQIQDFIERIASSLFRAATITKHEVRNLSDPEQPLVFEYTFKAPNFGMVVGKQMLFEQLVPAYRPGAAFASLDTRATPLQINREIDSSFQIALKLPPGAKVTELPSPSLFETRFGRYELRFSAGDGGVRIDNDFHIGAQRVKVEDYPELVEFCRSVDAAERKEIKVLLEE